jgi:hypothetical protein
MKTVTTVKLTTGEEFLAVISNGDEDEITFNKPMVLIDTGNGFQLIPWIMTLESEDVTLALKNIMFMGETQEAIAQGYLSATEEQLIQTPPTQGIITP